MEGNCEVVVRRIINSALEAQLKRLKEDKERQHGEIPLWLVLKINKEISDIERLLANKSWFIAMPYNGGK